MRYLKEFLEVRVEWFLKEFLKQFSDEVYNELVECGEKLEYICIYICVWVPRVWVWISGGILERISEASSCEIIQETTGKLCGKISRGIPGGISYGFSE